MDYMEMLRGSGLSDEDCVFAVWYARRKARLVGRDMEYADRYLLPDVVAGIVFSRETERRAHEGTRTDRDNTARYSQVG